MLVVDDKLVVALGTNAQTVMVGANEANHAVTVNGKRVDGHAAIGTGLASLPLGPLAAAATGSARFVLDVMRSGFATTPFDHSNRMIGPTRIFDPDGIWMCDVGVPDEPEDPDGD